MPEKIGRVVGTADTKNFEFAVKEDMEPAVFEYIRLEIKTGDGDTEKVLGQVTGLEKMNPAMSEGTPIEAVETMEQQGVDSTRTKAKAQVIGYLSETGVRKPRYAPKPGTAVEKAPDKFLESFVSVEEGLEVGSILTRDSVDAQLDIEGLNRHLAILAATGAGKSHTAGVIIEEMLDKGASIVALDPHGDYVKMSQEKNEGFDHTDKVQVFKARNPGSEQYQITVKTSKLGWRKLSELAGIREDFTNQRKMVRTAVEHVKEENGENYPYSLENLIDVLDRIQDDEILLDEDGNKTETIEHAEKVQFKLERLQSYGIFGTTEINFEELVSPRQLTVLDLSGIPFKAQDLISELVLNRIYQARVRHSLGEDGETYRYPIFTVVEEAHRLCPAETGKGMDSRAKEKLSEMASEGRKFGAFLTLITQRPSKIDEDVLSQCNSMIIQRIVNRKDQQSIASASESMAHGMIDELPGLNVGDAIITGPAVNIPSVVHIRERKTEHGGDDIDIPGNLEDAREDAEKRENTTDALGEEDSLDI